MMIIIIIQQYIQYVSIYIVFFTNIDVSLLGETYSLHYITTIQLKLYIVHDINATKQTCTHIRKELSLVSL